MFYEIIKHRNQNPLLPTPNQKKTTKLAASFDCEYQAIKMISQLMKEFKILQSLAVGRRKSSGDPLKLTLLFGVMLLIV